MWWTEHEISAAKATICSCSLPRPFSEKWCFFLQHLFGASLKNGFQEQKFKNLAPEIHPRLSAVSDLKRLFICLKTSFKTFCITVSSIHTCMYTSSTHHRLSPNRVSFRPEVRFETLLHPPSARPWTAGGSGRPHGGRTRPSGGLQPL